MDFFGWLTFAGGLALFLYGMQLMKEGLVRFAGGRMEIVLRELTGTPLRGVLAGTVVTALIQSSSAVTAMTVSFVNAGIMDLEQTVGIIMGSNIGTTVTAWILGFAGVKGNAQLAGIFSPATFAPTFAIAGVSVLLLSTKEKTKSIAAGLVGFAILLFGMNTMCQALQPLEQSIGFQTLMRGCAHPVTGLLAGTAVTALIQSSSASVGILQALCAGGTMTYQMVFPIIMGQNIGTCVTALLSGIGANLDARRTALIHLYLNVLGVAVCMPVCYLYDAICQGIWLKKAATPFGIAAIHSLFNVAVTFLFLPLSRYLVRLTYLYRGAHRPDPARKREV